MVFRIQSYCGSVLDPKFRERSRISQILSLKLVVPYLGFRTSRIPHTKRLKSYLSFFRTTIGNLEFSESSYFVDLKIFSAYGLQIQGNKLIINQDTLSNPGFRIKKLESRMNFLVDKQHKIDTPAITGFTVLPYNFYHFMTDFVLPFLACYGDGRILFLPFKPTVRQVEILNFLRIDFVNSAFQANHCLSDVRILPTIFKQREQGWENSSDPNSNYGFDSHRLSEAKRIISKIVPPEPSRNKTKVFLSRRGATRSPEEILEIELAFKIQGFIVYNAEDFPFAETVRIFQSAQLIVGIHGAGLTNMVLAQPGCRVIELDPVTHKFGGDIRPVFELMAEVIGFDYQKVNMPSSLNQWQDLASSLENF